MIPKERILKRIEEYESKSCPEPLKRYYSYLSRSVPAKIENFKKYPFYTLEYMLNKFGDKELNLAGNSDIQMGLPFDEIISFFGLHPNPSDIPIFKEKITNVKKRRLDPNFDSEFNLVPSWEESCDTFFKDYNPNIGVADNPYILFLEHLFGLERGVFMTTMTQAGWGIRLDTNSPMNRFWDKALKEKIKIFVDAVYLAKRDDESRAYIVNGFEI